MCDKVGYEGYVWTDQDYIDYVTGNMKDIKPPAREKTIADRIVDAVRARELFGLENRGVPFTEKSYPNNTKEAREELLDALFYTMAALVALDGVDDAQE